MRLAKAIAFVLVGAVLALPAVAQITVPEIRKQDVEERFGQRLKNATRAENLLLLGIALDTVNAESPFKDREIGIPYLVGDGAGYWALLLSQGDRSVDVLVNNALMLLFADKGDEVMPQIDRTAAAVKLLTLAQREGYWPASAYLAEHYFELAAQPVLPPLIPDHIQSRYRKAAFDYYMACTKVGFAPCHLKVGFWYLSDHKGEAGLSYLKAGIELVGRDKRYMTIPDVVGDTELALTLLSSPSLPHTVEEGAFYQSMRKLLREAQRGNI